MNGTVRGVLVKISSGDKVVGPAGMARAAVQRLDAE
jgi:hypothetical protein